MAATLRDHKFTHKKGDWISRKDFDRIWDQACDWFDKNIDRLVENIQSVYALTGNEFGYGALLANWQVRREWKGVGDTPRFSNDDIRSNIIEKLSTPFVTLWVQQDYGQTEFRHGYTGLMVTASLYVTKHQEDRYRLSHNLYLSLDISCNVNGAF